MTEWFSKQEMSLIAGLVEYEDFSIGSLRRFQFFKNYDPRLFLIKSKDIAYQNEYRFVPYDLEVNAPKIIDIGDLSDVSAIYNTVDLLNQELFLKVVKIHSREDNHQVAKKNK